MSSSLDEFSLYENEVSNKIYLDAGDLEEGNTYNVAYSDDGMMKDVRERTVDDYSCASSNFSATENSSVKIEDSVKVDFDGRPKNNRPSRSRSIARDRDHVLNFSGSTEGNGASLKKRYRGKSPQVVRTHRKFHEECHNPNSSLRELRGMLMDDSSLASLAVSPRSSIKGLVPLEIISSNFGLLGKNSGRKSLDELVLELVRLYPYGVVRRHHSTQCFPFVFVVKEWISFMNGSNRSVSEEHKKLNLEKISEYSLHIISLILDEIECQPMYSTEEKDIVMEFVDDLIPFAGSLLQVISGVENDMIRYRMFQCSLVHRILITCSTDSHEFGGIHPFHIVTNNASRLAQNPDDMWPTLQKVIKKAPLMIIYRDANGFLPFESNIRKCIEICCKGDDDSRASGYNSREIQFALSLLSSAYEFLSNSETVLLAKTSEYKAKHLTEVMIEAVSSIPNFIATLLRLKDQNMLDYFDLTIVSHVLKQKKHIHHIFQSSDIHVGLLFEELSNIVPFEEFAAQVFEDEFLLRKLAKCNVDDEAFLQSKAFRRFHDYALFTPASLLIVAADLLFVFLLLLMYGLYVDAWIQQKSNLASSTFFFILTLAFYFFCRGYFIGQEILSSKQLRFWAIFDVIGSMWLLLITIIAESYREEIQLDEVVLIHLAVGCTYIWIKSLLTLQVFNSQTAMVIGVVKQVIKDLAPFNLVMFFVSISFVQNLYILNAGDYEISTASILFMIIYSISLVSIFFGAMSCVAKNAFDKFQSKTWLNAQNSLFELHRLHYIIDLQLSIIFVKKGLSLGGITLYHFLIIFLVLVFVAIESLAGTQFQGSKEHLYLGIFFFNCSTMAFIVLMSYLRRSTFSGKIKSMLLTKLGLPHLLETQRKLSHCQSEKDKKHALTVDNDSEIQEEKFASVIQNALKNSEKRMSLIIRTEVHNLLSTLRNNEKQGSFQGYDKGSI